MSILIAYPSQWMNFLLGQQLIWIIPTVALFSTITSRDPAFTIRLSIQLVVATISIMIASEVLGAKRFTSAMTVAITLSVVLGLAFGSTEVIYGEQGDAVRGLFGSKNYFGMISGLACIFNLASGLERKKPGIVKSLNIMLFIVCALGLYRARSIDAVAGTIAGLSALLLCFFYEQIGYSYWAKLTFVIIVVAVFSVILFGVIELDFSSGSVLAAVGKNSSLTGRVYLWDRARQLIEERPLLGYGYGAFWRQEYPEAEGLWRVMKVPSRAGFHFHNSFYEMVIEVGYLGFALVGFTFLAVTTRIMAWFWSNPEVSRGLYLAVIVFFLIRSPFEVDVWGAYSIPAVLVTAMWVISAPTRQP